MNNETKIDGLNLLIKSHLNTLFTVIPAKITATPSSYGNKPFVDVLPLVRHVRSNGETYDFQECIKVPLQTIGCNGSKVKITIPIKVGDDVLLLYSQRDSSGFLNSDGTTVESPFFRKSLGEFPICALPCIFSYEDDSPDIDPNNIIIQNDKAITTIKPNGDSTFNNDKVTAEYLNNGTVNITNGSGNVTLQSSGNVDANGATINTGGNVITANGTDLDAFYQEYLAHFHNIIAPVGGTPVTPPV